MFWVSEAKQACATVLSVIVFGSCFYLFFFFINLFIHFTFRLTPLPPLFQSYPQKLFPHYPLPFSSEKGRPTMGTKLEILDQSPSKDHSIKGSHFANFCVFKDCVDYIPVNSDPGCLSQVISPVSAECY